MATIKQASNVPYLFLYILIFLTTFLQGGYFTVGLLILNISFIAYVLIQKEPIQVDANLLVMLSLLAVMMISAGLKSVDYYAAANEWLKYALFPLSYIVFMQIKDKQRVRTIFYRSFIVLMIFGLLGVLGFSLISGMVTMQGNRLQSFLQYANTTALFMGIGALFSIDRYMDSRKKGFIGLGILFTAALLLTQSRTTFVLFLLILGIYAFRLLHSRGRIIFVSSLLGLFGVLFAFGGRIVKISIFEPTLIERIITFQDAVRILFRETYGLGLGLGNWQFMQFFYQSAPYQVRYIHNFYLQAALDGGLLALALVAGLAVFQLVKGYKNKSVYLYIYIFILIHSFFEVNFNFGIMILFFTYLLTCLNEPVYLKNRFTQLNSNSILKYTKYAKYAGIVPLIICIIMFISEIYVSNGNLKENTNKQEALRYYQAAYTLNPLHKQLLYKQAKMERNVDRAIAYLEEGYASNPYDYQVLKALSEGYLYKKDYGKSYLYADQLFNIFPYSKEHQLLVDQILKQYAASHMISVDQYHLLNKKLLDTLESKQASMNPLYRYIHQDGQY